MAFGSIFFRPVLSVSGCLHPLVARLRENLNILPSIDGKGSGFGNKISIQTVDLVNAFKHLGHAYNIQKGNPVCIYDTCFRILSTADEESRNGLFAHSRTRRPFTSFSCKKCWTGERYLMESKVTTSARPGK